MPRVMGTLGSPGPAWFLLGSKRPLQSLGWLPMDVPQFTISPPKPPVNGCCTEATIVLDVPVPAVSTRSTTLCWAGSWRVAGATHVHSPSLRTRAWAPRRGLGHWARPGRQAPGTSSPLSAEDVLLRGGERPHQASVGPAGWTSALQQQRGGGGVFVQGRMGMGSELLPPAAGSWPSGWLGPEREESGRGHPVWGGLGARVGIGEVLGSTYGNVPRRALQAPWAGRAGPSSPWGAWVTSAWPRARGDSGIRSVSWS